MTREELLQSIGAARTELDVTIARIPRNQMTTSDLPGGWSVKDVLAHLAWWQYRVAMIYQALKEGVRPESVLVSGTIDELNAMVLADYRERDLDEVIKMEQQAYQALRDIAESVPELDLFGHHTFNWTGGQPFSDWIAGDTYEHYREHLPALTAKAQRHAAAGEILQRARVFLENSGRHIDMVRLDYHFGSVNVQELLDVLSGYQGEDGGLHGLEIDIKSPVSNPFAAAVALHALVWAVQVANPNSPGALQAIQNSSFFQGLLNWLEGTQLADGGWILAAEVYESELIDWAKNMTWPNLTPGLTIYGLLRQLDAGSPQLQARVYRLFENHASSADLLGDEFYNVSPYADYLQTEWDFPQSEFYRMGVVWWMLKALSGSMLDPYHFFALAPTPDSAIAKRLPPELIQEQLVRLIDEQQEDGGWPTIYAPHWRPWITVTNLLVLRAYGKI